MWTLLWLLWGTAFVAVEGSALVNHTAGDTLSETVWRWLRVGPYKNPASVTWSWRVFMVGAFLVWLFFHLTFGWFAA